MDYQSFEDWLSRLDQADLNFLNRHSMWARDWIRARKKRVLPDGFLEKTMEILEGGSESET